ncbi:aminomethyl-transferring glycine dehydrogenase subunit GcvPB [Desulfuribacillus alkaliarsenatis]|uniref:Probable glycine dehydrogenase (decarboxylating) subunit 2 n=1 Tax=Desulfuribacillus alkaliarsenatis TaxID=766136 RepID=A0A1E5G5H2_9FIRM|nr:aminomethyl-transferring glycine dehydrogenase subunit GcvPB [Desulfuribacillus alkaliarsenatis]OEF98418.1 glycine dehydrogenase (aminomethyl-transferring) [Desulfuribacillus alkaliarsenatis]
MSQPLIFEISKAGRRASTIPAIDVPAQDITDFIPQQYLRDEPVDLPEVSEVDVVRHYTALSRRSFGVDNGFYPLGSCTMKYNPKINEDMAQLTGFANIHPYQEPVTVQGALQLMYELERDLSEITGMERFSLQPAAGAHGEWAALMMIRAYHEAKGEQRNKVLIPDTAHGTNPASATVAGFETITIKSNAQGGVDIEDLKSHLGADVAAIMLTNPSTLGLFEEQILEIAQLVHKAGGLLYYDGANLNAIVGKVRPGDMGFDIVHLNLHKTFSTPHGGGGPGAGPIGVAKHLVPYLPVPMIEKDDNQDKYYFDYDIPDSIGKIKGFYGNFGVLVRAYAYIRTMGPDGLRAVAENAVLNANYLMHALKDDYQLAFNQTCMHEFVLSAAKQKKNGVRALDIAKRLLDFGYHPPTIYFPLLVDEAMMIEPTETESKETLDEFIRVMKQIAQESEQQPEQVNSAPTTTVITRLDEVKAARSPVLIWQKDM